MHAGRAFRSSSLHIDECDDVGERGARGPVAVDLVRMVGIAEGDAADHAAIIAEIEVTANQARVTRERGLRNGAEAERLRRQHEITDIGAAIDGAIGTERLGRVDDRDMRRAKEIVILQRLLGVGGLVASGYAERVVELEAAFAPPLQIDAEIFAWSRKIVIVPGAGCG